MNKATRILTEVADDKYSVISICEDHSLGEIRKVTKGVFGFFPESEQFQSLFVDELEEISSFIRKLQERS